MVFVVLVSDVLCFLQVCLCLNHMPTELEFNICTGRLYLIIYQTKYFSLLDLDKRAVTKLLALAGCPIAFLDCLRSTHLHVLFHMSANVTLLLNRITHDSVKVKGVALPSFHRFITNF